MDIGGGPIIFSFNNPFSKKTNFHLFPFFGGITNFVADDIPKVECKYRVLSSLMGSVTAILFWFIILRFFVKSIPFLKYLREFILAVNSSPSILTIIGALKRYGHKFPCYSLAGLIGTSPQLNWSKTIASAIILDVQVQTINLIPMSYSGFSDGSSIIFYIANHFYDPNIAEILSGYLSLLLKIVIIICTLWLIPKIFRIFNLNDRIIKRSLPRSTKPIFEP